MNISRSSVQILYPGVARFPGFINQQRWIDLIEEVSLGTYKFLEVDRRPHLTMALPTWFSKNDSQSAIKLRSMFLSEALPAISSYMNINSLSAMVPKKDFITVSKLFPNKSMAEHRDNADDLSNHFICMMYINDDFSGGELNLKDAGITYKPIAGDIIIYKANMMHEVMPSDGLRYSIGYGLTE